MSTSNHDDALANWRTLRDALAATIAEGEAVYKAQGLEAYNLYRAHMPPRKRGKMQGPPTSASELASQSRNWHAAISEADREALKPALEAMVLLLRAADDRTLAARQALRSAARQVPTAVVGEGAEWRLIRSDWHSSHRSITTTQNMAALTAHDLLHLGYQVRCVTRLRPADQHSYLGPVQAFEVWAWTCADGAEIAPHQHPAGEVAEPPLRWEQTAADVGLAR